MDENKVAKITRFYFASSPSKIVEHLIHDKPIDGADYSRGTNISNSRPALYARLQKAYVAMRAAPAKYPPSPAVAAIGKLIYNGGFGRIRFIPALSTLIDGVPLVIMKPNYEWIDKSGAEADGTTKVLPNRNILKDLRNQEHTYRALPRTQKEAVIQSRLGQGQFRRKLLRHWGCCSVTKCSEPKELLVASHIKPWRKSTNAERLDVNNGFLLLPNLDKLFDNGLISFSDKGKIMISRKLSKPTWKFFGIHKEMKLIREISPDQGKYLDYHRDKVFQK